ncbi:MAG: flippase [Bacteroidetes bacterium]|nr:flippase [Bacteroidota bacterium]
MTSPKTLKSPLLIISPYLKKVFANISWLSFDQIIRMGVNTLTGILIARYLGKDLYGVFSYATAYIMIFSPMINFGFDSLIIRDLLRQPEKRDEIMGSSFLLRIIGAVTAISVIFISIQFVTKANILYLGVLYIFEMGFGALGLIIIYTQLQGFSLKQWHLTFQRAGYVMKESWPLLFAAASTFIYMRIDQVLIGRMINDGAVGIYSASTKIFELPFVLLSIFNTSFFPMLNELYNTDRERFYNRYEFLTGMYTFISIVILIGTLLFADYAVKLLFGAAFEDAGTILKIQIIGLVFLYNAGLRSLYLTITSNQKLLLNTSITSAVLNIVLNVLFIPSYGIRGSAVATVITIAFSLLFQNIIYKPTRKIFYLQLKSLLPILFVSEMTGRVISLVKRKIG